MCEEQTTPVTETEETVEEKPKKKKKASAPDAKITELEEALAAKEAELAEQKEIYARMLAEYANYKRRTEQEKESLGTFARADILEKLLPSLDDLERASGAADGPDYRKGVEMIVKKLHTQLEKLGLTEIPAQGEPFDPEIHNAVMREDADGVEPDTVTEVFQKGYRYGDRVIRPAMVKVAN
ncbi:MAG: nucleotide exchange factor GrpE [Clostridia bacterium]|nr:nucleotide exchange factor GrpE [Clostridia bacterium]